jgi:hypothetical protein
MCWEARAWAKRCRLGSPALKALLLCLADHADADGGSCYPGQELLAWETEQTDRNVRRQLAQLEELGAITRSRRFRKNGTRTSDSYKLHLDRQIVRHDDPRPLPVPEDEDDDQQPADNLTTGQIVRPPEPTQERTSGIADRADYRTSEPSPPDIASGLTTGHSYVQGTTRELPGVDPARARTRDDGRSNDEKSTAEPSDAATRRAGFGTIRRKLQCDEAWAERIARQFDALAASAIHDHDAYYGRCIDEHIRKHGLASLLPTPTPRQARCGRCHSPHPPDVACAGPRGNLSGLSAARDALRDASHSPVSGSDEAPTSGSPMAGVA